jgi:hypothetical protein
MICSSSFPRPRGHEITGRRGRRGRRGPKGPAWGRRGLPETSPWSYSPYSPLALAPSCRFLAIFPRYPLKSGDLSCPTCPLPRTQRRMICPSNTGASASAPSPGSKSQSKPRFAAFCEGASSGRPLRLKQLAGGAEAPRALKRAPLRRVPSRTGGAGRGGGDALSHYFFRPYLIPPTTT